MADQKPPSEGDEARDILPLRPNDSLAHASKNLFGDMPKDWQSNPVFFRGMRIIAAHHPDILKEIRDILKDTNVPKEEKARRINTIVLGYSQLKIWTPEEDLPPPPSGRER